MGPPRPGRARGPGSRWAEPAISGVLRAEEAVHRCCERCAGWSCCTGADCASWMPPSVRTRSGRELDREHAKDGGDEGAGHRPPPRREQPAMVGAPRHAGSVRRASGPRAVRGAVRAGVAGCSCGSLLCLERPHDLLGGGRVASKPLGCTGVEVLMDVQLRERRAVEGEAVGEAERERGEVLIRLAGSEVRGRGRSCLALFAASASVLEGP